MICWQHFKHLFSSWRRWKSIDPSSDWTGEAPLQLDDTLQASLRSLAKDQKCSENELVSDLIYSALARRTVELEINMELFHRWENLTPREQQVTMLVCRGYTNRQIAVRLGLSPATVKVYIRHILVKLGFHSKRELRVALEGWISSTG